MNIHKQTTYPRNTYAISKWNSGIEWQHFRTGSDPGDHLVQLPGLMHKAAKDQRDRWSDLPEGIMSARS